MVKRSKRIRQTTEAATPVAKAQKVSTQLPPAEDSEDIESNIEEDISAEEQVDDKKDNTTTDDESSATVFHRSHGKVGGQVLTFGQGDTGQLGLGPDVMERMKPACVTLPHPVVQIAAGGMHTVCVLDNGEVYTFGCNDEGALGRDTSEEGTEYSPGRVDLDENVIQVAAGDSHTAALTTRGTVYAWGCFRSSDGVLGLSQEYKETTPICIFSEIPIVKICSGSDHLVMLSKSGSLYTLGCAEQGQLGRVAGYFSSRGGRQGVRRLLSPGLVRRKREKFVDVWCGAYTVYTLTINNTVYAWGLNNYHQLGTKKEGNKFAPERMKAFNFNIGGDVEWLEMDGGLHHSIALDTTGRVYSCGRAEYGRLGHGEQDQEVKFTPTQITGVQNNKMTTISTGGATSYCVSEQGDVFAWGMGSNYQLGTGEEDDLHEPTKVKGKQLQERKVIKVSGGGQHTVLLVQSKLALKTES